MKINIYFSYPANPITINNQHDVNSFIHRTLGHNGYHDTFSNYSISSLQGGRYIGNGLIDFPSEQPWIQVASQDTEFILSLIMALNSTNNTLLGMKYDRFDKNDFVVGNSSDVVYTISPILLKDKDTGFKITFRDDNWLNKLISNCKNKLSRLSTPIIDDSFNIELIDIENAKVKKIIVKDDCWAIASQVIMKVSGKKETRIALYEMGFGGSTGSGFGSVKILNKFH